MVDEELEKIRKRKFEELKKMVKWPKGVVELDSAKLKEFIKEFNTVVVDCWAEWCAPCKMISPIVEELAHEEIGKIVFGKINVDKNPIISISYQIEGIPTLLVFKDGKMVKRVVGVRPKEAIKREVESV